MRSTGTDAETQLRQALWALGLRYRVHVRLPGTPDIVFPRPKTAIFVDGCFWHGCPAHYIKPVANADFWRAKLERNRARDTRVDRELQEAGWRVLRIWTHEVEKDAAAVARRIHDLLAGSPKPEDAG